MKYKINTICKFSFTFFMLLVVSACAEKRNAADSGDDMYVVSDGMLAVDTEAAGRSGIFILDRNGDKLTGVIPLRYGLSISQDDAGSAVIGASPDALIVLDANRDNLIDAKDPAWENMHLAVDYNGDGSIGQGEYALIGECGVDALKIDVQAGQAWSLHSDGETKIVKLPNTA
jgi:hypothetical protein